MRFDGGIERVCEEEVLRGRDTTAARGEEEHLDVFIRAL
jgi:hypothetical protein|tara:strand:- start:4636 stop:4752 length:117 start_codon:yes stop_codon:yes gene_type:complete